MAQSLPLASNTRSHLTRYAWMSIAAALSTILLKTAAYWVTGSVGLLSDAMESVVNLAGAVMALAMLIIAARPPDDDHAHGHAKAEYFSSGVEGTLILLAALSIAWTAVIRLLNPQSLEQPGLGLVISSVAALVNFFVAMILLRAGKKHDSITLDADAKHLLADVWTSIGVIVGVALTAISGWLWLDPVVALAVAANILFEGSRLITRSIRGLMDASLPAAELRLVEQILDRFRSTEVNFHALRTRQAGYNRFISFHLLVPGAWTIQRGHELAEEVEEALAGALANVSVITHLEPLEAPASWDEHVLVRQSGEKS